MRSEPVPFKKIVFVCINKRDNGEACCADRDGESIAAALKARVKALGMARFVRVSKSGCQDLCAKGANVMVFPDHLCYHGVTPADVDRIVDDTVRGLPPPA